MAGARKNKGRPQGLEAVKEAAPGEVTCRQRSYPQRPNSDFLGPVELSAAVRVDSPTRENRPDTKWRDPTGIAGDFRLRKLADRFSAKVVKVIVRDDHHVDD